MLSQPSTHLQSPSFTPAMLAERPVLTHRSSSLSSTSSIFSDVSVDAITVEGLPHSDSKLEARKYKTARFAETFLGIIHEHGVSSWIRVTDPATIKVVKVAGSLTNAVFFVSVPLELAPTPVPPRTLLLRIYGPSSGALISRPRELHTLHVLSSQYRIGPRVWGTFANGRVEEFFESEALTAACLREPSTSRWIGMRMAELHSVDLEAAEGTPHPAEGEGKTWDIAARRNVREWLAPAQEVLSMPCVPSAVAQAFDLAGFMDIWMRYSDWLAAFEHRAGKSPRVFCHNDTQYGNLLRVTHPDKSVSEHRQIIVVDFEYASPNAAAFDIANHFHEWTADYHGAQPHRLDPARYPTAAERRNLYKGYLAVVDPSASVGPLDLDALDAQVRAWSPASHAMWAIWGVVQAREQLEGEDVEFDYVSYARCRFQLFRDEVARLGI